MKPSEMTFSESASTAQRLHIEERIRAADSLEDLILGWVQVEKEEVQVFQGEDKDRPTVEMIGVTLCEEGSELVQIYFPKSDIAALYSETVLISKFIGGSDRLGEYELDDQAIDLWEAKLGFTYSEALCEMIGPRKALMPFVLSYVLSEGGGVSLQPAVTLDGPLDDVQEELIAERIEIDQTVLLSATYQAREVRKGMQAGWGCERYIRLDSADGGLKRRSHSDRAGH
jgi:hypothetical protein